jgi:lipid A ethanolaminephosphotransferase
MSDSLAKSEKVNVGCLKAQTTSPLSHDNLFHTVLGMMNVQTSSYRSALDFTAPCKPLAGGSYSASECSIWPGSSARRLCTSLL